MKFMNHKELLFILIIYVLFLYFIADIYNRYDYYQTNNNRQYQLFGDMNQNDQQWVYINQYRNQYGNNYLSPYEDQFNSIPLQSSSNYNQQYYSNYPVTYQQQQQVYKYQRNVYQPESSQYYDNTQPRYYHFSEIVQSQKNKEYTPPQPSAINPINTPSQLSPHIVQNKMQNENYYNFNNNYYSAENLNNSDTVKVKDHFKLPKPLTTDSIPNDISVIKDDDKSYYNSGRPSTTSPGQIILDGDLNSRDNSFTIDNIENKTDSFISSDQNKVIDNIDEELNKISVENINLKNEEEKKVLKEVEVGEKIKNEEMKKIEEPIKTEEPIIIEKPIDTEKPINKKPNKAKKSTIEESIKVEEQKVEESIKVEETKIQKPKVEKPTIEIENTQENEKPLSVNTTPKDEKNKINNHDTLKCEKEVPKPESIIPENDKNTTVDIKDYDDLSSISPNIIPCTPKPLPIDNSGYITPPFENKLLNETKKTHIPITLTPHRVSVSSVNDSTQSSPILKKEKKIKKTPSLSPKIVKNIEKITIDNNV